MEKKVGSGYYKNQPNPGNLIGKLALKVRLEMYKQLIALVNPDPKLRILDVGVTSDTRDGTNFIEKIYPYPQNLVGIGLEKNYSIKKQFPDITYVCANGLELPFKDKSFHLVTSFAVIEHVGNRFQQEYFLNELCRVGKKCFVTTPNRWHPIDVHTLIPIIHWFPPSLFRKILRIMGNDFYAKEENLNLLDARELKKMFPDNMHVSECYFRLFGLVSNLMFFAQSYK
ncbi:MAG: methyltransferase domain-containing protein [Desulfobacterales bacterium]|nr:methyltransferase domain-containing protein [Desulfobacterales bacterium]